MGPYYTPTSDTSKLSLAFSDLSRWVRRPQTIKRTNYFDYIGTSKRQCLHHVECHLLRLKLLLSKKLPFYILVVRVATKPHEKNHVVYSSQTTCEGDVSRFTDVTIRLLRGYSRGVSNRDMKAGKLRLSIYLHPPQGSILRYKFHNGASSRALCPLHILPVICKAADSCELCPRLLVTACRATLLRK